VRRSGGEHAAGVVPHGGTPDVSSQQTHPRTDYHFDCGMMLEDTHEVRDRVERRRQVRVPVAHEIYVGLQRPLQAQAHGFCFSHIRRECQNRDPVRLLRGKTVQNTACAIAAAVVDEHQAER